jgi:hypothetical protein
MRIHLNSMPLAALWNTNSARKAITFTRKFKVLNMVRGEVAYNSLYRVCDLLYKLKVFKP